MTAFVAFVVSFQEKLDSDEEWDCLVELTEQALVTRPSQQHAISGDDDGLNVKLMTDAVFIKKVQATLSVLLAQVLDGLLEAASRLRQILRVFISLLQTDW